MTGSTTSPHSRQNSAMQYKTPVLADDLAARIESSSHVEGASVYDSIRVNTPKIARRNRTLNRSVDFQKRGGIGEILKTQALTPKS